MLAGFHKVNKLFQFFIEHFVIHFHIFNYTKFLWFLLEKEGEVE